MSTVISIPKMPIRAFLGLFLACCYISGIIGDGAVYTDLHKTVQLGDRVVLKCEFLGTPLAVYWKKGKDPTIKQSMMSWFGDEQLAGTCVKDKTCDMGDDFSLIIKNVSTAHHARYICRVANYKGILIYNITDLKVFALPGEPFPVIEECKKYQGQSCTFSNVAAIYITCTASRYFQHIDLFFLHGSQNFTTLKTWESTNSDGTKNKSIFTTAQPSKKPYVCVAFNIPGFQDQRTATVSFPGHSATNNTHSPDENDGSSLMQIVVPLAFLGGAILLGVLVAICLICFIKSGRNHNSTDVERQHLLQDSTDEERQHLLQDGTVEERQHLLQGPVSLYELWYLASYKTTEYHKKKLRNVLTELDISDIKEGQLTPLETYKALCTWRNGTRTEDQLKALEKALGRVRYDGAWTDMYDTCRGKDKSIDVSPEKLKQILLHIGNFCHMNQFLNMLIRDRTNINEETAHDFQVQSCLAELTEWITSRRYELNPFVLLSNALERVGCTALDMVDFWVPENLESPITVDGLEKFLNELTARHCKRLAIYLKINLKKLIILGNNYYLFDTKSMITDHADCLRDEGCSNYRQRCKLDDAIIRMGRYDLQDHFETSSYRDGAGLLAEHPHPRPHQFDAESIYDDDIPHLAKMIRCIPPDKRTRFQEKTGLNPDDSGENDTLEERIKKWRDSVMANRSKDQSLNEFRSLRQELNNTKYSECIGSKSHTKHVTGEELPRIAYHLMMEDVRPIIKALDIDQSTIRKYVKQWDGKGSCTIELVKELLKNRGRFHRSDRDREDFCQVLSKIGFVDVARSVYFGQYKTESQEGSTSVWDMPGE